MGSARDLPFVSAMIVVRNEESMIGQCLDSLMAQDYPRHRYEVIVVDGMSEDETLAAVEERCGGLPRIRIIENPKRILAPGWNTGVRAATGEYVVRLDAHAVVYPDFLRRSVETMLSRPEAGCVGGSMEARGATGTWLGQAISEVLNSPFGVGNARYRRSGKAQYADTVAFGLYRRHLLLELGGFDEAMRRNQDLDMDSRIRRAGWKFYLDPSIRATYYARGSFRGFLIQAWQNGWWNILTLLKDARAVSIRHVVPLVFVLFLLVTGVGGLFLRPLWYALAGVLAVYLSLAVVCSIAGSSSAMGMAVKPVLFPSLHVSYGAGSLACATSRFFVWARKRWRRRPPPLPTGPFR